MTPNDTKDGEESKPLDLRMRLTLEDTRMMRKIKKYYNLRSWTQVVSFCLAAVDREIEDKN